MSSIYIPSRGYLPLHGWFHIVGAKLRFTRILHPVGLDSDRWPSTSTSQVWDTKCWEF
jgi:hypothetical protein